MKPLLLLFLLFLTAITSFAAILPRFRPAPDGSLLSFTPPNTPRLPVTGKTFLTQTRNPNYRPNGPLALAKIYRKYNRPLPADLLSYLTTLSPQRRSWGTVSVDPQPHDLEYLTSISIGTPPQTLFIDVDTGSADLWVFSPAISKDELGGDNRLVYDPNKSTTARKMDGASWEIEYGDGSYSSGDVWLDRVEIGNLSFPDQAVEAAREVSEQFTRDTANDGILGLAFSSINEVRPKRQLTFWDNLLPTLDEPVFTVDLRRNASGHLTFGYIPPVSPPLPISYTPVNSSLGYWHFTPLGFSVSSLPQNPPILSPSPPLRSAQQPLPGLADTGATLLLLPQSVVDTYYSHVGSARYSSEVAGVTFRCTAVLPDLVITATEERNVTVRGDVLRYMEMEGDEGKERVCYGGLQSDAGLGFSVYGDVFLKSTFVVFDVGGMRLGFGEKFGIE